MQYVKLITLKSLETHQFKEVKSKLKYFFDSLLVLSGMEKLPFSKGFNFHFFIRHANNCILFG